MNTNTVAEPQRFNLAELNSVMANAKAPIVGFLVSQKVWDALADRFLQESGAPLAPIPNSFQGVEIVVDPDLPDTAMDVAFSREAWNKRLRDLRGKR